MGFVVFGFALTYLLFSCGFLDHSTSQKELTPEWKDGRNWERVRETERERERERERGQKRNNKFYFDSCAMNNKFIKNTKDVMIYKSYSVANNIKNPIQSNTILTCRQQQKNGNFQSSYLCQFILPVMS